MPCRASAVQRDATPDRYLDAALPWLAVFAAGFGATLLAGCEREPTALTEPHGWTAATLAEDPFAELRPPDLDCPGTAVAVEDELIEIETSDCSHVTLLQPAATFVRAGERVAGLLSTSALVNDDVAEGHAVITIDGYTALDLTVAIPGPSAFHDFELLAPARIDVGAPVVLHVRNHGANSWRLQRLDVEP